MRHWAFCLKRAESLPLRLMRRAITPLAYGGNLKLAFRLLLHESFARITFADIAARCERRFACWSVTFSSTMP
jgi:hypothetical protein